MQGGYDEAENGSLCGSPTVAYSVYALHKCPVLGYAFVIFLLLRIFFPDRSSELPPLTGKK
jgi:hypothetical protein